MTEPSTKFDALPKRALVVMDHHELESLQGLYEPAAAELERRARRRAAKAAGDLEAIRKSAPPKGDVSDKAIRLVVNALFAELTANDLAG